MSVASGSQTVAVLLGLPEPLIKMPGLKFVKHLKLNHLHYLKYVKVSSEILDIKGTLYKGV